MIQSVQLINWMSHKNTLIYFDNGMNLLYGRNGSGKTSILYALHWGMLSKSPIRAQLPKNFIRIGCDRATVVIEFIVPDQPKLIYKLTRTLFTDSRKNRAELITKDQNGFRIESYNDRPLRKINEINQKMYEMLRISKKISISSFFLKEGELGHYLMSTPNDRKEQIFEIFKINKLDEVRKAIIKTINSLKLQQADFEQQLHPLDTELQILEKIDINDLLRKQNRLSLELEPLKSELDVKISSPLINKKYTIDTKTSQIITSRARLEDEIKSLFDQKTRILSKGSVKQLKIISEKKAPIQLKIENIEAELDNIEHEIRQIRSEINYLDSRRTLLNYETISDQGICPTCEQKITETMLTKLIKEITDQVYESKSKLDYLTLRKYDLKQSVQDLIDKVSKSNEAASNLLIIADIEKEIKEVNKDIDSHDQRLKEYQQVELDKLGQADPRLNLEKLRKIEYLETDLLKINQVIAKGYERKDRIDFIVSLKSSIYENREKVVKKISILETLRKVLADVQFNSELIDYNSFEKLEVMGIEEVFDFGS